MVKNEAAWHMQSRIEKGDGVLAAPYMYSGTES